VKTIQEQIIHFKKFSILLFAFLITYSYAQLPRHTIQLNFTAVPNQVISEDSMFTSIRLDNYVHDSEYDPDKIEWTYSNNRELIVSIDSNRIATIERPFPDWTGSEKITFTISNPHGLNSSASIICMSVSHNFVSSNLPIVFINTNGQSIPNEPKITADMGIIYNGEGSRNYITDPWNNYNGKIGIERRGHSSQKLFPKKQYGFETRDDNGENLNVSLLGFPAENDWILYAPYSDKTLMRNVLAYHLSNELGRYASRTKFCELILNGEYHGIYVLMEKIKQDRNRVDISEIDDSDISGGYILEMTHKNKLQPGEVHFLSTQIINRTYAYKYPKGVDITEEQKAWIESYFYVFENTWYGNHPKDADFGFAKYIDVPSCIDFTLLNELFRNVDAFHASTFIYKDRGEKLKIGPLWDYNIAMGNCNYANGWKPRGWQMTVRQKAGIFLQDESFLMQYIERWGELRQDRLSLDYIMKKIDETAELLSEARVRNFQRWDVLGTYVWPNYFIGDSYEEEIDYLKQWLEERILWMDEQWKIQLSLNPVINEINYCSSNDFDTGDWIELYNPRDSSIYLSGWYVKNESDENTFIFPVNTVIESNGYIVLCQDTSAFHSRFQDAENYIGNMDFSLHDEGELIRLFDASDNLIDALTYNNDPPWPIEPAGYGATLELKKPNMNNALAQNWAASESHGTPGESNSISTSADAGLHGRVPEKFTLKQNYPNPFNSETTIEYGLPITSEVSLKIFNILGQEVRKLAYVSQKAGSYRVVWDGRDNQGQEVASGIYFYGISANKFNKIQKMIMLR